MVTIGVPRIEAEMCSSRSCVCHTSKWGGSQARHANVISELRLAKRDRHGERQGEFEDIFWWTEFFLWWLGI